MISLVPDANSFDAVNEMLDKLANLSAGHRQRVADAIRQGFNDNFTREQAGDEAPWIPLTSHTIAQRRRKGYGPGPMLQRSGKLRDSFTRRGAEGHVETFATTRNGWQLEVGSSDVRAGLLGFGGVGGLGHYIPPRPIIFLGADSENRIFDELDLIMDQIFSND